MNIPEGFVLVPVELTSSMIESGKDERMECLARPSLSVQAALARIYGRIIDSAPDVELPAYDEAAELAACRAHWEKNPNCLFSDMWLGWKACAQSRDGSVSDE